MRNHLLIGIILASLTGRTVFGGTFTNSLSNPNQTMGLSFNGGAAIKNGELVLTPSVTGAQGSFTVDDLDAGGAIESFTARFQLKFVLPNNTPPADGLSFCFGPGLNASSNFGVEGAGAAAAVCVEFDTYDNSAPDNVGIDLKVGGQEIATTPMTYQQLVDSQFHGVVIQLNRNGTLNVAWNGQTIYTNFWLADWNPINGQFAFGASTGFFTEESDLKNLSLTTSVAGATITPTITMQPPASESVVEATPLMLSVGFDGSAPLSFQWSLNGTPIVDGTDPVLKIPHVPLTNNGAKITCTISNPGGSITSQTNVLTVTADTTPLTIKSVVGSDTLKLVTVTFSKPVLGSAAQTVANYSIAGLTVSAAMPSTNDESQVILTTTAQIVGAAYTLVVNNIQDLTQAGHTIATNSQKTFHAFSYVSGYMVYDIYEDQGFNAGLTYVQQLEASFDSLVPTRTLVFPSADTPDWEYGGNYGSLSQGLILAPETGLYIFHVASDDQSQLFLSTDDTPAHLRSGPICQVTTWSGHLDWAGTYGLGSPDTNPQTGNKSNPINLVASQKYFFRDFHVEGTGPDGISIGWELPSSHGTINVIPGTNLLALLNTDVSAVPTVAINQTSTGIVVTFAGTLQSAGIVTGPWTNEPGTSPLTINPNAVMKFYRAKQ